MPPGAVDPLLHGVPDQAVVLVPALHPGQVAAVQRADLPRLVPVPRRVGEQVVLAAQRHPAGGCGEINQESKIAICQSK